MGKSNLLHHKMLEKANVSLICILGMFASFLVSRAGLSIFMFLFGINALRDVPVRQWLQQKWWLLGLAWVGMYALSGLWSTDMDEWNNHVQVKLPFLLMPIAFAWAPPFSQRHLQIFTAAVAGMLVMAAGYTMGKFLSDPQFYIAEYKVSHMLPTLPKKDYIRSSTATALTLVWCIYAWPQLTHKVRVFTGVCIGIIMVYLHILAAKSGLVSLYLFLGMWAIYLTIGRRKLIGLVVLIALPLAGMVAVRAIPTLRERANYIGFTIYMYTHGHSTNNLGDVARLVSYELATDLIRQHPLTGVGAGDMRLEMNKLYTTRYPAIEEHGRLVPHNMFLVVALACGMGTALLFAIWVFWPLAWLRRNRQSFFFFAVWLILFVQLMIEPGLEIQFGVFVYLFFLLLHLREVRQPFNRPALPADDHQ